MKHTTPDPVFVCHRLVVNCVGILALTPDFIVMHVSDYPALLDPDMHSQRKL